MQDKLVRVHIGAGKEYDVSVDEVLGYLDDDEIVAALERRSRRRHGVGAVTKVQLIYEEFHRRNLDAPKVLKDFIYEMLGKVLQ